MKDFSGNRRERGYRCLQTALVETEARYAFKATAPNALAAYKDFLTLWKDADPDIPILQQAKAEYAKLK